MQIGIISDTHNHIKNVEKAIKIFKSKKVKIIFHAGDFIDNTVVEKFKGMRVFGVFGNNDQDKKNLMKSFSKIRGEISEFCYKEMAGLKFCMYHGTERKLLQKIIRAQDYDVIIYGHTHKVVQKRVGNSTLLNPGPANGKWSKATILIFNTHDKTSKVFYL